MAGVHRVPDIMRRADTLARRGATASASCGHDE
jgi:hypothetical protein